jgi:hypothetical protein
MVNSENKKISSIKLLSCELDFFKKWIEFQFDETMTWENHGEWHFDHVKPCSSFDLTKIEEQQILFLLEKFSPIGKNRKFEKEK